MLKKECIFVFTVINNQETKCRLLELNQTASSKFMIQKDVLH